MSLRRIIVASLAGLAFAVPLEANGGPSECRGAYSTQDMLICLGRKLDEQDARLNRLWTKALAAESEQGRALLRKAQRAWIAFRDAQCAYERGPEPAGSGAAVDKTLCLLRMTAERADWLAEQAGEDAAGDGGGNR